MRTAGFGLDSKGLAIVWNRSLRLTLRHQEFSKKLVGIRKLGISAQGRLQISLRLVETPGPAEQQRVIVPGGGIAGPEPEGDFKLIPRLTAPDSPSMPDSAGRRIQRPTPIRTTSLRFDMKNDALVLKQPMSYYLGQGLTTQAIITNLQWLDPAAGLW